MITATSEAQFALASSGPLPPLEQVREQLWVLALDMPVGLIRYSLCYLLLDARGGVHVIDPGWHSEANRERLGAALAHLGKSVRDIASIVSTHLHADHMGHAERLREESGAPVVLHPAEQAGIVSMTDFAVFEAELTAEVSRWGVPAERLDEIMHTVLNPVARPVGEAGFTADVLVEDGELLQLPGHRIRALHTPGHTSGHLCLRDEDAALLWSGDHLLPTLYPGIGLGGRTDSNPVEDYLLSLDRIAGFDGDEVLPGHGYRFRGLAHRVHQTAHHHLRRAGEVSAGLAAAPDATVWQLASGLSWSAGWERLRDFPLMSALRQTATHAELVRSGRYEPLAARWA